jgi:hypothetical protein
VQGQIVQQPGGLPIRKANIRLFNGDGGETNYAALTDEEGRFAFEGVKPGNYRLRCERAGFVDAEKRHHQWGTLLSLEPGQEIKDLLFHMAPAAVILGKVTDKDGDPVPNAEVAAIPYGTTLHGNNIPMFAGAVTNDVGEYRIGGLFPNRYLVMVQAPSELVRAAIVKGGDTDLPAYPTTYYPGTADKGLAIPLALRPGDETPANVTLTLVRLAHLRGVVTNFSASASDTKVILRPKDDGYMLETELWPVDKNGRFDIHGVLPGSYGFLIVFGGDKMAQMMRGDQIVQVASADVDGLRISPLANGQIRGRFRMDNGEKVDWSQFDVRFRSTQRIAFGSSLSSGRTFEAVSWDELSPNPEVRNDGSFEMTDVPAGTYDLHIASARKSLQDYFVKAVNLGGKDIADSVFTVGGARYSMDIVVSAKGSTLEGVVVDGKDKPASDVTVICIPDAKRRERHDLYQQDTTDHRGEFSLRGLNPGEYRVFALDTDIDEEEMTDPEFVRAHEALGQTVKLEEGERKSLVLKLDAGD